MRIFAHSRLGIHLLAFWCVFWLSSCAANKTKKIDANESAVEQSGPQIEDGEVESREIPINTDSPLNNTAPANPVPLGTADSKICLVLGPGMARGFAHVGVIEAFQEAQIKLHCIVGVEMGALVGGLYADSQNLNTVNWQLFKLKRDVYLDVPLFSIKQRTAAGERLGKLMLDALGGRRVRELRLPFTTIATEENSGNAVAFTDEPAAEAIMASIAVPGVFKPRMVGGRGPFVSGLVSSPLGLKEAADLGGTQFVVVDLLADNFSTNRGDGLDAEIAKQFLVAKNLEKFQKTSATLVISPDLRAYSFTDFDKRAEIVSVGKRAAFEGIQRMRQATAPKVEEAKP